MSLSYDEIAEIVKIIDGSSCDEVIVETGDIRLIVRRNIAGITATPAPVAAPAIGATAAAPALRITPQPAAAPAKTAIAPHQIEVVAPMVGTFYRAPSPDAAPFVEVGSAVRKGDPLCLIEVMKLFTAVSAGVKGIIRRILVNDSEMVEYDQTLFYIEPQ